jgi:hypothetical protein
LLPSGEAIRDTAVPDVQEHHFNSDDEPTEPVIWFTCRTCGYSWCVPRDPS